MSSLDFADNVFKMSYLFGEINLRHLQIQLQLFQQPAEVLLILIHEI